MDHVNNTTLWSDYLGKKLLLVALSLALLTHGVIIYFTLPKTYDAYVHMFFADHYGRFWFEPWEYRWYTGFLTISYPPLVHQMIALIAKVFPLKVAFCIYAIFIYQILVIGVYRFTKIFFDKTTAGVAAIVAVLLSSMVETLHVYGQLPTLNGLAFLLNALPFLYQYFLKGKHIYLVMALVFLAVTVSSHHVTAIFGMVFFIAPTIFMALVDGLPEENKTQSFFKFLGIFIRVALKKYKQIILFGVVMIILMIGLIFPYWYWSKTDPITQVSIPHGSRDNFFKNFSSGLIFYIVPLTLIFALLPAITFSITRKKRYIAWGVSFFLCLLLGSGGTTPLPKMLLGSNAFNILTLDRFGFWASIIAIPFMAKFTHSFVAGSVQQFWIKKFGRSFHFILSGLSGLSYLLFIVFIFHLASFRPLQPKEIEIEPMLNFLNRDNHMRWRYLTLGFGDQMAWLSANSLAASVDGNYHSARRLPELTSRPVERLENAKFSGIAGLASLNDFLTDAEKYSLKYVFSNDRYYDPLLYYSGWSRTIRLENGIMVWEKGNISTIKPMVSKTVSPLLIKMWGILPVGSFCIAVLLTVIYLRWYKENEYFGSYADNETHYPKVHIYTSSFLPVLFFTVFISFQVYELLLVKEQNTPKDTVLNFYNNLDFQRFEQAYHFFKPTPTYTLDQYLLEKSVNDGGLLPSYAKLDSIDVKQTSLKNDSAKLSVYTRWRTSLGFREKTEQLELVRLDKTWSILPPNFSPEIPEEQMRSYTYTLFKKVGKRVISSFPTVKDDKVKKPFAAFKQVNFVSDRTRNFITGEILNADDVPINLAMKAVVVFKDSSQKEFYPKTVIQYNLSPKASTYFQIDLDINSLKIASISLFLETDVSERGYIHGGTPSFKINDNGKGSLLIKTRIFNELTTDLNIPGVLIAEKDNEGRIWQTQLAVFPTAIRSGLNREFNFSFKKIQPQAKMGSALIIDTYINGTKRKVIPLQKDSLANQNYGISMIPHCFLSQEIYLQ
jgi:hypothetical protein